MELWLNILENVALNCPQSLKTLYMTHTLFRNILDKYPVLWIQAGMVILFGKGIKYTARLPCLYIACSLNNELACYYFIKANLDPNETSRLFNQTPLFLCAKNNNPRICRMLMEKTDYDITDINGMSAFHLACQNGSLDIVKLIYQKVNLEKVTLDGFTPVHLAIMGNYCSVVEFILQNMQLRNGESYLHFAISHDRPEILKLLLAFYSPDSHDSLGQTPLHTAILHNNYQIVLMLLYNSAGFNFASGVAYMTLAVKQRAFLILFLLIKHQAETNHSLVLIKYAAQLWFGGFLVYSYLLQI
jgi:ankyrin repeat protein